MGTQRIGVIHLNQIGDLVFSLPLLKALKDQAPGSEVHSILRPHLRELLSASPFVDRLISRKRGLKNQIDLLGELRRQKYDLLVTLSNSTECLLLAGLSGARLKAGFSNWPWDLGLDVKEKVEGHHGWYNNAKLLRRMKIDIRKDDYVGLLVLPPRESPEPGGPHPEKVVVISPGASLRRRVKAWEEKKFGELIVRLKERYDLHPMIVGGPEDREVIDQVIGFVKEMDRGGTVTSIPNLAGKLSLKDLCYLLKGASLFVGVDSGIMHLASSLDIPVVGIFGPSDPFYVAPQNARSAIVREEGMDCVPCYLKGCEARECMKRIKVEKVFEACERLLNR